MSHEIQSVVLIGAGNVAWHLGRKLSGAGIRILQVAGRSIRSAKFLADELHTGYAGELQAIRPDADAYVISVSDDSISEVIQQTDFGDHIAMHTAGSVPADVFKDRVKHYGVLYPLQTFTKGRDVRFNEIPLLIEASDPATLKRISGLAGLLSDHVIITDSLRRRQIHLAAVFACNFTNRMYALAEKILRREGLDFDLLKPLIRETLNKAVELSPLKAQTGPAVRGNTEIIELHLSMLGHDPELRKLYKMISKNIADAGQ
ncbi:MAG: DUF2520 domain-containing protein [Bacteroidales bacterium]|nr:DUF2520 domain-containing protein [Bacteroidales bacterium]